MIRVIRRSNPRRWLYVNIHNVRHADELADSTSSMMDPNFATVWEQIALAVPDRVAAWQDGRALSYRELDDRAGRLAAGLRAAGAARGSKVAIYLLNSPEYLLALFAAFKLGAVPVNVNYRYRERELAGLLADAQADALIFDGTLSDRAELAVGAIPSLKIAVRVGEGDVGLDLANVLATHEPVEHETRSGDEPLFVYTGGTTGPPKAVVWPQRELYASVAKPTFLSTTGREPPATLDGLLEVVRDLDARDAAPRTLVVAPLMHATGLFATMSTLLVGGCAVFAPGPSFDPATVWRTVDDQRVTMLVVAGNAIARPLAETLLNAERTGTPYRLDTLQSIVSSGVAWTDDVKRVLLARAQVTLTDALASSEGGPYAISEVSSVHELPSRFTLTPGTVVLDEHGDEVEPGSVGMLAFSGPLPLGYHGEAEQTSGVFFERDGRRHVMPGDLVRLRTDRTIELLGRGAAVINTGGEKVYPGEVEEILLRSPDIVDCVVIGVPDPRWGEVVTAVVTLEPGAAGKESALAESMAEYVSARLAGYKKPRHIVVVDALPRGPNAKLDLNAVRTTAERAVRAGA